MATAETALNLTTKDSVDLFLVGKTGHGKSSTGNSIIGRKAFPVSDGAEAATNMVRVACTRRLHTVIKVVDGPGVRETRYDRGEAAKKMVEDMSLGIMMCPQGFHAMILVLKYGNRFTEEELTTVMTLKDLFGRNFVRDFCIIVLTHGENFEMNNEETPERTFEDWLKDQKGPMEDLIQECDNKVVLFYNRRPKRNEAQLQKLLEMVDELKSLGIRYTNELFREVADTRERLVVKANMPQLEEKIQTKIDLLVDGLEKVREHSQMNDTVKDILSNLKKDARELEIYIAVEDRKTGVLSPLLENTRSILSTVEMHEEMLRERKGKADMAAMLEEVLRRHTENLKNIADEKDRRMRTLKKQINVLKNEKLQSHCTFL